MVIRKTILPKNLGHKTATHNHLSPYMFIPTISLGSIVTATFVNIAYILSVLSYAQKFIDPMVIFKSIFIE